MKNLWLLIVILFVVSGCADSSTTGNISEKEQKQDIVVNNTGANSLSVVYFPVYYATDTDTTTSQETAGTSTFSPKSALGYQGTGSLAEEGASQVLDDITTTIQKWQDNRKKDSENPITTTKDSYNPTTTTTTTPTVIPVTPPGDDGDEDGNDDANPPSTDPIDLSKVEWLHTDVSKWKQTATLRSVSTGGGKIRLDYNKAHTWPVGKEDLNANPWIFVKQDGKWLAATWEWMRKGQTSKSISAVAGDHIKKSELANFKPKTGETYGFMVSGLARDHHTNVQERTNVVMYKWK